MNRKERQKRGVSILLMLLMVLTTMMPSWAYGTETTGASAADQLTSETSGETSDGSDAKQPGAADRNAPADTETSGGTQDDASAAQDQQEGAADRAATDASSDNKTDKTAATGGYFAVISADRTGTEKSKDAPYIEAGIVKLQGSRSVEVKKDQLSKQESGAYKGSQDLNDSGAGYSEGNSYEVALKNYYGDDGSARDGYRLEGIDINGYMIRMSEIEADSDHHIHIARGSISGYDGDADAYVNSENGKDIGLSFAGSGAFSSDLKVTFIFSDDAEKADNAAAQQDAVKAVAKAASKTGAAGAKVASSHENQVRVIVENTTYPQSEGALWDGTLVDTWVDLNDDSTMMSCIVAALDTVGAKQTGAESNYLSEINGLGEFDGGSMSGWMGTLNDWFTNEGFGAFTVAAGKLNAGDEIRVMYTCSYGSDIGGSWGNNDKRVIAVEASEGTISPEFDKDTHEYTLTLPEGTKSVTIRPTAANKNFQVRTFAGDKEYKRNDAIPVSSGTEILVKCGDPSWSSMNSSSDPAQEYTLTVKIKEPVTVKADVTVSFQQANTYLMTPQTLSVDSDLAERYGYTDTVDPEKSVSALDVLVRMHEVMLEDAFNADTKDGILAVNDGMISTIMGEETTAVGFAVNGAFPYDPDSEYNSAYGYTGYKINQAPVADGDSMDVFFYQDSYYTDYYTWFEQDGSKVSSLSVKQCESISLDLQGVMYAYCGSLKKEDAIKQGGLGPVEDAQLTVVDAATGASEDISGAVTDEDGHAEISFKKAGTYYVSAYGSEYTPITSPWLKVSVTSSAPVLKAGVPENTTASVKKGQAYNLDLDSIFEDPQNDKLTYTVSVDGAEAAAAESSYSVTFDSTGTHKLVFRASDGLVSSEDTYTVELTVEKPEQARLESLIIHTGASPSNTSVLVKNKGDKYTSGQVFDPETSEYVLAAQTDSVSQLRFRAKASDSSAKVTVYYGDGQSKDITWKSGSSKFANCLSPGKNTITIKVEPAAGSDKEGTEYTFAVDCVPTLTGITAKSSGTELYLDKQFSSSVGEYVLTIPETAETVDLTAVPKNQGYTVLYNGKESPAVDVKGREKIEITVSTGSGDSRLENKYILDLRRAAKLDFKADVTPDDAIVKVYDSEGSEVKANKDGSFSGMFAEYDYTYLITKYGYVAQSGKVPAAGGALKITLEKAADDGLKDVSSDWNNFRGSDSNMGITDVMTPVSKDDTTLLWNAKLGSGWSAAPSVQIIVDDALIVMAGTTIYKLDLKTGETLKTGTMAGSPSYGYTPPVYAEGMIFCPLGSGTIQAFNAETLESLWIYRDPLRGQALSPITYSNGYIYTGFWNSEVKDANYVCISVTDEDVTRTDEEKQATWRHRQSGGYYWAGSVAVGNCVIVGNDDGGSGTSGDSTLTSYDSLTGEVISELQLKGAGDQRSSIAYDKESGRVYFTTKGGYLCSAAVDAKTGKLSSLKMVNYNAQSTSTPVVYKGNVYFATGSGISSSGSSGNFVVADADTLEMRYAVGLKGYPQCSMLMSTAYEDEGYLYFYATYNMKPGGISMIKVRNDSKAADDAELIELYDAEGFEEYCISSIICDRNGTLYYKNDSGNVFAVGLPDYKTVRNLIDRIGEVTLDSRAAIDTARKAYDALSDENKEKVTNYDKLVAAEKKLAQLEAEKKREDEKKNENSSKGGATGASGSTKSAGSVTKTADVKLSGELTEKAKAVIEKIKAVNSSDLPEKAESFTEDQIRSVTEAYKAYNELSAAEKKAAESDDSWKAFSKITAKLGMMYHYDKDSGIDVRDNKEKALPWYIKLSITAAELSSSQEKAVKDVIGEDSEIFTMNDISFINTLDGSEWHPEDLIKVKMPSADIGSYKSAIIVHISDDGKVQLIEGGTDEADGTVSFESSDFSLYGIAGSMESVDSLLGAQQRADVMPWLILAGAAAAALIVIACLKVRRRKKADR